MEANPVFNSSVLAASACPGRESVMVYMIVLVTMMKKIAINERASLLPLEVNLNTGRASRSKKFIATPSQ